MYKNVLNFNFEGKPRKMTTVDYYSIVLQYRHVEKKIISYENKILYLKGYLSHVNV